MKKLLWVGGAIGVATNALSLVKLITHFFKIGLAGIPAFVLQGYSSFVADLQYWLIELPFDIKVQAWIVHAFIVWVIFAGSNWRFLAYNQNGARLYRSFGDIGRGEKPAKSPVVVHALNIIFMLAGPLFAVFVLAMWFGNWQMGPTGLGHWGDRFMIGNRSYTLRLARLYLLILILAPALAAILVAWGAAGDIEREVTAAIVLDGRERNDDYRLNT